MRRERTQVLCCMLGITTLFGPFVGRLAGVPVVLNAQRNLGYWLGHGVRALVYGYVSRRVVDGILVNSSAARRELIERFRVRPELIYETGAGVDVEAIAATEPSGGDRSELGLDGMKVVGTVGKLSRVKDHQTFLRAAGMIAAERDDVAFLVVGEGPLRRELEDLTGELGLGGRVHFLGRRGDVPSLLKLMDVFALTSVSEGLPNVVMEAQAASLPVVATNVGGVPEVVDDGVSGLLVEPRDHAGLARALSSLLGDPQLAARMGRAGHETVRLEYGLDAAAQGFEDALKRTLERAKGTRVS
jgi:glycosyltransferase involved in cell wall biosynthesis